MRKATRVWIWLLAAVLLFSGCVGNTDPETTTPQAEESEIGVITIKTDSFTMDCARFGKGDRALVILPGLSVQPVNAAAVAQAYDMFADEFTVFLLEPRRNLPDDYRIEDLADDAAAAIRELELENVCLFGVSMGGMIAQALTIRNPGLVERLILGSTFPGETETLTKNLDAWTALAKDGDAEGLYLAFGQAVYAKETFEQYRDAMVDAAKTVTAAELERFTVLAESMRGFDVAGSLDGILCPVLYLGAKDDRVLGEDAAARFASLLEEKTDAESYIYDGYGHAAYDFAPDYKDRMLRFLSPAPVPAEDLEILHEPEFGGVYIKMTIEDFNALGFSYGDSVNVSFSNGYTLEGLPYYNGYYTANGDPLLIAYPGYDYIKAAINNGDDLWNVAGLGETDLATVTLAEKGAFADIQNARDIHYTDRREDYGSDEVFANFRSVKAGRIAPGVLYRSASPCDNQHFRATFVNDLMEAAGVKYIVDLADTEEKIEGYINGKDFANEYFLTLYRGDCVIPLGLNMNFGSEVFAQKIARGCESMAAHEGPYLAHCTEGKDRTGYFCMLLEALCGASYEEIRADYMLTYDNYYGISEEKDPARYRVIVENVLDPMLRAMLGDGEADLSAADLAAGAKAFLLNAGLSESTIESLISRLCG